MNTIHKLIETVRREVRDRRRIGSISKKDAALVNDSLNEILARCSTTFVDPWPKRSSAARAVRRREPSDRNRVRFTKQERVKSKEQKKPLVALAYESRESNPAGSFLEMTGLVNQEDAQRVVDLMTELFAKGK